MLNGQKLLVGIEPTIFRLEGGRDIHFATEAVGFACRMTTEAVGFACRMTTEAVGASPSTTMDVAASQFLHAPFYDQISKEKTIEVLRKDIQEIVGNIFLERGQGGSNPIQTPDPHHKIKETLLLRDL